MKISLKEQAINFRRDGWSYNIIAERLRVSKSTLSHWLREVPYAPNDEVRKRIREGPAKSAVVRLNERLKAIIEAKSKAALEVGKIDVRDLFMLGIGLYIGEGSKEYENIRMANSDPEIVRVMVRWFIDICKVRRENFSLVVHLYPDISVKKALKYWSEITGIPISQFGKTQIDMRQNKSRTRRRKLPYGTVHIRILSRGDQNFGVMFHRKIIGWIEAVYRQTRV